MMYLKDMIIIFSLSCICLKFKEYDNKQSSKIFNVTSYLYTIYVIYLCLSSSLMHSKNHKGRGDILSVTRSVDNIIAVGACIFCLHYPHVMKLDATQQT